LPTDIKPSVKRKEAPAIITWNQGDKSSTTSIKSSGMEIRDYHDCFKELNPPLKPELGSP